MFTVKKLTIDRSKKAFMECYFLLLFLYDHMLDATCLRILHVEILTILDIYESAMVFLEFWLKSVCRISYVVSKRREYALWII